MIVKNEEKVLARCLDSAAKWFDEVIIIDTGSTDKTRAIALGFTDHVHDLTWMNDFAQARQYAVNFATSDWVVWLDADDVLEGGKYIRQIIDQTPEDINCIQWRYVLGRDLHGNVMMELWRERAIRSSAKTHWQGKIHEVILFDEPMRAVKSSQVFVEHLPAPDLTNEGSGRNLQILLDEVETMQDSVEPRTLFYLANEYFDAKRWVEAIGVYERYVLLGSWDDEVYTALLRIAVCWRAQGLHMLAVEAALRSLAIHPTWPQAYFDLAQSQYYLQRWDYVIHWCEIGLEMQSPDTILFVNPMDWEFNWIVFYTNALYHVGMIQEALLWTQKALGIRPSDSYHLHNLTFFRSLTSEQELSN